MPLYTAFKNNERFASRHENAATIATGMRVPVALGDFMVLDAVRESGGMVMAANEHDIVKYQKQVAAAEGVLICPEAATCVDALGQLSESGMISSDDRVVIFNTAAGQKYFGGNKLELPRLDISQPINWETFEEQYLT